MQSKVGFHQDRRHGEAQRSTSARSLPHIDRASALCLLGLARPYAGRLALAALCMLVSTISTLAIPYAIRLLTDAIFVHRDASGLNRVTLLLLGVAITTAVFGFGRGYLVYYVGTRIVADLRLRLYRHLLDLPVAFYDEWRLGDLLSRLSSDTTVVQTVLSDDLLTFVQNVTTIAAAIVAIFLLDWRLALVTITAAPAIALSGVIIGRKTRRLSQQAQQQLGQATVVLEESLSSVRVIKAFVREHFEMGRYASAVEHSMCSTLYAVRLQSLFQSLMMLAGFSAVAAILWVGGREVLAGRLSPGALISFLLYLILLLGPLESLASIYGAFQRAAGGAARVFEVLNIQSVTLDAPDAYQLPHVCGHVEVRDLWFRYAPHSPDVLRGVNLIARPGERVAIVGRSGAGKTTLVSLLLRFYPATRGSIHIDGHDLRHVTVESLRRSIAIVPQDTILFAGTVRENIAYGREGASDAEIERAACAANAHDFIQALPERYATIIGDRGVKLSLGQRQRIAIARAILKDPRILILDEATSALDNEAEAIVREALERLMTGRTTLVITHRLMTVKDADRVIVLEGGKVEEEGTHTTLMTRDALYRRLYTRSFKRSRNPQAGVRVDSDK